MDKNFRFPLGTKNPDLPEVFWQFFSSKSYVGSRLAANPEKFLRKLYSYVEAGAKELTANPPPPAKTRYAYLMSSQETAFKINGKPVFLFLQVCYDRTTKSYEDGRAGAAPEEEVVKLIEEWKKDFDVGSPSDN